MNKEEVLENLIIDNLVVKLPNVQLEPKVYQEVKKQMERVGGKWKGGKIQGFLFQEDPTTYIEDLRVGKKRNLQQEFQFFPTPHKVALEMADWYLSSYETILEPSAGDGALLKALYEKHPKLKDVQIDVCELMPLNREKLLSMDGNINILSEDFMKVPMDKGYDFIMANPPFTKNQDINHVMKMFNHLNEDGRMVVITSTHWVHSTNSLEQTFKQFINNHMIYMEELPSDTFKESKTSVKTMFIVLEK